MKKIILNLVLIILTNTLINAQYTGGYGRGDAMAVLTSSPLPVELSSFTASVIGSEVILKWQTETEVNNYGFEIERYALSAERQAWHKIGFVNGNGNSNSPKEYSFTDNLTTNLTHTLGYRLKQIDNDGQFEYSDIIEVDLGAPSTFQLSQNFPNPFNPGTIISWQSPVDGWQSLKVYDILGNEVATLVDEYKAAGKYNLEFSMNNLQLTSGVYFYQLIIGNFTSTKKMTYLR